MPRKRLRMHSGAYTSQNSTSVFIVCLQQTNHNHAPSGPHTTLLSIHLVKCLHFLTRPRYLQPHSGARDNSRLDNIMPLGPWSQCLLLTFSCSPNVPIRSCSSSGLFVVKQLDSKNHAVSIARHAVHILCVRSCPAPFDYTCAAYC